MSIDFTSIRAAVFDMDGVLWRMSDILPGVDELFAFLQQQPIPYAMATNNSTKTVSTYVERLNRIGIPISPDRVITSAVATAGYISRRYPTQTAVYIIGGEGIRRALAERGYHEDPEQAKLVVVGLDFDITYDKLKTATLRIRAGADFIGTNGDLTFPTPDGLVPGNGSLLAAIEAATGQAPFLIGKPETAMFEEALNAVGAAPEQTLMVGDRLETDILGAQRAGLQTALVLTGITSAEQARTGNIQADGVFDNLLDLYTTWEASLQPAV
ncbi:MAG: HAD-IIA family hydrolase [Anaerolineae bacterium]|nr:HAD-IIA family hydrolase [Anaerolineae bacterium]